MAAVTSRLAVARVSPDGAHPAAAAAAGGRMKRARSGLAAFPAARKGRRRGGAVAASPRTLDLEALQMTEPLAKDDLVAYLVSGGGYKAKENWSGPVTVCSMKCS